MKTYDHLFTEITAFDNLYAAARSARKGKKATPESDHFHFYLERELLQLQAELRSRSYQPGPYQTFTVYDPKTRMISAAPYRDRVVHHALCRVIEPIFDRTFIFDSYANRTGKGVHRAIKRYQHFAQRYPWVLKCDIRKFFPSLDHAILKQALRRKIACQATLWLADLIIDNSNPQEPHAPYFPGDDLFTPFQRRKGLPIGNLTSQFWANVYLNAFDHYIKEELGVKGYIRYVDDFVLFAPDKHTLHQWREALTARLARLRLLPHPTKTQVYETRRGVPFLGFRVFPRHRYVQKPKVWRYHRHLRKQVAQLQPEGQEAFVSGLNSWLGHIRFGQSSRLQDRTFVYLRNKGLGLFQRPGGSWGLVDQQQ